MFRYDPQTTSDDATGADEPAELMPVRVADVLRRLQATLPARGVSIALEVDESLHIAADEPLLLAALADMLGRALSSGHGEAPVVVRCRAEELGVAIEVEGELTEHQTDSASWRARRLIEAMAEVRSSENHSQEGRVFALHFPLLSSKRASAAPARRSASGLMRATAQPPPRKTGDGSF